MLVLYAELRFVSFMKHDYRVHQSFWSMAVLTVAYWSILGNIR